MRVLCGVLDESSLPPFPPPLPSHAALDELTHTDSTPNEPSHSHPTVIPHPTLDEHHPSTRDNSYQQPTNVLQVVSFDSPRWKSLRRRVVGRLRRSLPEYEYGGPAEVEVGE